MNPEGPSPYSNEATIRTLLAPPDAPASLAASSVSGTRIDLAWTDGSINEEGFRIERKSGGGAFLEIGTGPPNIARYRDTTVTPLTAYTYRVRAYNASGTSGHSNEAGATSGVPPPAEPSD